MIAVTGGAGFIGSAIIWKLNTLGITNIVVVDELGLENKWKNLAGLSFSDFINKYDFLKMVESSTAPYLEAIIHMGANSSTTETDADFLLRNNYEYSKSLANFCLKKNIRFIYASSAATYGDGSSGFSDSEKDSGAFLPLNMYGYSKHLFDRWAYNEGLLDRIAGLKYFNVYGPNEYHKGDMRSVVHKAFEQIRETRKVRLFKSLNPAYKDGEQMRDFLYIKDAVDMTLFFLEHKDKSGIYNIGSGKARTWNDLVTAIFKAMNLPVNIEYIDMPPLLAGKYQYFTEADMGKIRRAGYTKPIQKLEEGVNDYVKNYLLKEGYLCGS